MKELLFGAFLTIATAMIYISGSQFMAGYYMYFGVRLPELDPGLQEILSKAAQPIITASLDVMPIALIFFLIAIMACFASPKIRENFAILSTTIACTIAATVVILSASIGWKLGQERAENSILSMPVFRFADATRLTEILDIIGPSPRPVFRHIAATAGHHYIHTEYEGQRYSWTVRLNRSGSPESFVFLAR